MRLSWSISLSLIDVHCRKLPCDSHECCSDCRGPPATVVKSSNRERHAARHSARGIGFENRTLPTYEPSRFTPDSGSREILRSSPSKRRWYYCAAVIIAACGYVIYSIV